MENTYRSLEDRDPEIYPDKDYENCNPNVNAQEKFLKLEQFKSWGNSNEDEDDDSELPNDSTIKFLNIQPSTSYQTFFPINQILRKIRDIAEEGRLKEALHNLKAHKGELKKLLSTKEKERYQICYFIAYIYYKCFLYVRAHKWLLRAKVIQEEFNKELGLGPRDLSTLHGMIGDVLVYLKGYKEGQEYLKRSLKINEQSLRGPHQLMDSVKNASRAFVEMGETNDEIGYLQGMLESRESLDDENRYGRPPKETLITNCYNDMVELYFERNDFESPTELLRKAVEQLQYGELRDLWFMARCKRNQAKINVYEKDIGSAVKNYKDALTILRDSTPPNNYLILQYEQELESLLK